MNQEQEYEEAAHRIENFLVDFDISSGDIDYYEPTDLRQLYHYAARRLLSLTWPSGQRLLAVLASNQAVPETAYTAALEPDTWERIQSDLRTEGFRRVVLPFVPDIQEAK